MSPVCSYFDPDKNKMWHWLVSRDCSALRLESNSFSIWLKCNTHLLHKLRTGKWWLTTSLKNSQLDREQIISRSHQRGMNWGCRIQTIDGYKGRLNKILTNTTTNVLPNIINLVEDMDDSLIIWRAEMTRDERCNERCKGRMYNYVRMDRRSNKRT